MSIAGLVKKLRDETGAPMNWCKQALVECDHVIEDAKDWIRKKGGDAAGKKSGRVSAEGLVGVGVRRGVTGQEGVLVELNSETDFAAKNERFVALLSAIVDAAYGANGDVEALKEAKLPSGKTVQETITENVAVIGENLQLRRAADLKGDIVVSYIHNRVTEGAGKLGVLVAANTTGDRDKAADMARKVAMHVAAFRPKALDVAGLDPALVERERNVLTEQARESGKPDAVIEKMIEGRIRKFYSETVLLEQLFVMDNKTPVKQVLQEAKKEIGGDVVITGYVYFILGEGVEQQ
jgi:elongation factor Ts